MLQKTISQQIFHLSVFATKTISQEILHLSVFAKVFAVTQNYFSASIKLFHTQTFETASIKYLIALNHLGTRMMNAVPFQFEQQCKNQI